MPLSQKTLCMYLKDDPWGDITKLCLKHQAKSKQINQPYSPQKSSANHFRETWIQSVHIQKPTKCQKQNSTNIPKMMKMFNILNNTARNLDNTEAARGFCWKYLFLKSKIWSKILLNFRKILEKYLRRNSYWSKPSSFSQQLY